MPRIPPSDQLLRRLEETSTTPSYEGRVLEVAGLLVEGTAVGGRLGDLYRIKNPDGQWILGEVVSIHGERVRLMPMGDTRGIGAGSVLIRDPEMTRVRVGPHLLGHVLGPMGEPLDVDRLPRTGEEFEVWSAPPNPLERSLIDEPLSLGIKVLDSMLTIGKGQRIGIFAGPGVGKSTLLGSIARHSGADVNVIALIGERGRELGEFLERNLGPDGLARSVVVIASSDQSAPLRVRGAALATAIAEGFRAMGKDVLLLLDSLTRFAMAGREIGLAVGEPPTTKGYTPSVFAALPRLLERPGKLKGQGSITAIYTVLVEGDDMSDPIADAVLAILDGHVILSRSLNQEGQFPPVDVLKSISRLMREITDPAHYSDAHLLRRVLSVYERSRDLISIGAYQKGSDPWVDLAVEIRPQIMEFFAQEPSERWELDASVDRLSEIATVIRKYMGTT